MAGIAPTIADLAVPVADLRPYGPNPRRGDVDGIAESLAVNGQYRPVVVNRRTMEILAGNHTYAAAVKLGWEQIAATFVDVDDEAAARIVLVDNRSNDRAGYDDAALVELLGSLDDLAGSGFTDADLRALLVEQSGGEPAALTDPDEAPGLPAEPVSRPGDVWRLGPHVLWCGDAMDTGGLLGALDGAVPDCVWTDPPYGVSYVGKTADALTIVNDGKDGLPGLLAGAFATLVAVCRPGAPVYVAHADTERITFEQAMSGAGLRVRQNLVWVKNTIVLGRSDYHYRHEPILEADVPCDDPDHQPILYGFALGGKGRLGRGGDRWFGDNKQSTVIAVDKPPRNADHPTMKPIELIRPMIANSCPPGGLVLDLFGGSGSTLIAAHHERKRAALVEMDPRYVDVICRRWQDHTGVVPTRDGRPVDFRAEGQAA